MRYIDETGLTAAGFISHRPKQHLTIVIKGLFTAAPGTTAQLQAGEARITGDEAFEPPVEGRLRYASDVVPFKVAADVMLVGGRRRNDDEPRPRVSVGDHRFEAPPETRGPAGLVTAFAPVAVDSPSRQRWLGKAYDDEWLERLWPWYARDFDPRFFNGAPQAMQLDGYLLGDETLTARYLHPTEDRYEVPLPGMKVRCFLDERLDGVPRFRELELKLDTLWLDVDAEQLALVWRGDTPVSDDDCSQVEHVFVATDPPESPLTVEEHQAQMALALVKKPAFGRSAPPSVPAPTAESPAANDNQPPATDEAGVIARLHQVLVGMKAPADILEVVSSRSSMAEINAELARRVSPDPDKAAELVQQSQDKLVEMARQHDPGLGKTPEPEPVSESSPGHSRESVKAAVEAGKSLAEADLSGLDLSQLDLTGAQLQHARLKRAKLAGTTLFNADLSAADLRETDLTAAVFGTAQLPGADLTGAKAADVDLWRADLTDATLDRAQLSGARLEEARASGASFRNANLTSAKLRGCQLVAARLRGATLHEAVFDEANLEGASIEDVTADSASFAHANLRRLRARRVVLSRVDLREIDADGSNWMGAELIEAKFTRSRLRRADLSRTKLTGAALDACDCAAADFTSAELDRADLRHSNFAGARFELAKMQRVDLREANLYEAEVWRAELEGARLEGACVVASKLATEESSS